MTTSLTKLEQKLKDENLLTRKQLTEIRRLQDKSGKSLPILLAENDFVPAETLILAIGQLHDFPAAHISNYTIDPLVVKLIPEHLASQYKVIVLFRVGDSLTLAMADPSNVVAIDTIKKETGCEINPVVCPLREIEDAISRYYEEKDSLEAILQKIQSGSGEVDRKGYHQYDKAAPARDMSGLEFKTDVEDASKHDPEDAPIISLVNLILSNGLRVQASDIHMEPHRDKLLVRYRVDGILRDVQKFEPQIIPPVTSRLKLIAGLDIAERRTPQDGHITIGFREEEFDLRVSTLPTIFGEKIVMRILDRSKGLVPLKKLGFNSDNLKHFQQLLKAPNGIILATGPTGSGKTTTLYAALSEINERIRNIITLEDPVEYQLEGINQVQIRPTAGVTFSKGLRAILRQDPDVIMLGEIRDVETAEIAIHSALTGHLVLSTLHTNDAPSSITRLIDMGIAPFLVGSAVIGILSQRLVRVLCPNCKEEYTPDLIDLQSLGLPENDPGPFFRPVGCRVCEKEGYKGRTAVHELLVIMPRIQHLIRAGAGVEEIENAARNDGFKTLQENGIHKIRNSVTSIEEILRIT
jgi:type IV pilus assembly protein PilB